MTILLGLILVVLISLIDAKLWTVLGFIPLHQLLLRLQRILLLYS
jgi:hypothetical protein